MESLTPGTHRKIAKALGSGNRVDRLPDNGQQPCELPLVARGGEDA